MAEQGSKATRKAQRLATQHALKERKKLRSKRAAIHAAIDETELIRKRRKRGRADRDKIMLELGYERVGEDGKGLAPEQKYTEVL